MTIIFIVQEWLFLVAQSGEDIISFSFQGSFRSRLNFNYYVSSAFTSWLTGAFDYFCSDYYDKQYSDKYFIYYLSLNWYNNSVKLHDCNFMFIQSSHYCFSLFSTLEISKIATKLFNAKEVQVH